MNRSGEQGFALPVAIFAMVIAMTVIAAGTFVARQETKIGSAVQMGAAAFQLAEAGVNEVMADWPVTALSDMPVWTDTTFVHHLASGTTTTKVTRIDDRLYLLESESDVTEGGPLLAGASRSTGLVVRLLRPVITPPAALTTRG